MSPVKAVAGTAYSDDSDRSIWIVLDFLPESGYVHIDSAAGAEALVLPDSEQQLFASERMAAVLHESNQQIELFRLEFKRSSIPDGLSFAQVDRERP